MSIWIKLGVAILDAELMQFYQDVLLSFNMVKNYFEYLSEIMEAYLMKGADHIIHGLNIGRLLYSARLGWCLGGESAKALIYRFLYYFSDQYYLYQFFGWKNYLSLLPYSRNVIAQVSLEYLVLLKRKLACSKLNEFEKLHMKTRS